MINGTAINEIAINASEGGGPPPFSESGEGQLIAIEQQIVDPNPPDRSGNAINQRAINEFLINGSEPFSASGEGELIAIEQSVGASGEGELVAIEQSVGIRGEGELIAIEQDVHLRITGEGEVIEIEQTVAHSAGGELIKIEQTIIDDANQPIPIPSHLERTGWDLTLMVGGAQVPREQIHDMVTITRTEAGASLMDVTIIPPRGVQDVESYAGKPVTVDVRTIEGIFRVYTGLVDIPEVNIIGKKITLHCTDRRSELINSQLRSVVSTIGYYSSVIFGPAKDTFEELTNRLTTVSKTVDFDAFGNYYVADLHPKVTPDYTLLDNKVYYRDPKVEYTSRGRITNKITISFGYRFERLWHIQRTWSWTSPIAGNICLALQQGYTFAQRSMVRAAVEGLSWPLRGEINFTPIQSPGWYCGGIGFTTISFNSGGGLTIPQLDSNGDPVLDSSGNPVMTTSGSFTNVGELLTNGASWIGTKRWVQSIAEQYTLVVQAPQSQAQYGTVESFNSYANDDDTESSKWESDYKSYNNPYSQVDPTYFIDNAQGRNVANAAISTALNIAKTTILNSHRDTRVTIYRSLWPQIDLKHTVEIDTGVLAARGKVYNITHTLNIGTGEAVTMVVLALSRSQGSQADSSLSIPARPIDTTLPDSSPIVLGNHYGQDPSQPAAKFWNGRIGNAIVGFSRTQYPEQFVVDTPEIPNQFRQERTLTGGATYSISIPSNLLEVTF